MHPQPQLTPASPPLAASDARWRIEGPLVINTVADWHGRLTERLARTPEFTIDLGGMTAVDTFGLQFLLAIQRSATANGRSINIEAAPPIFDDVCLSTGIARSDFSTPQS